MLSLCNDKIIHVVNGKIVLSQSQLNECHDFAVMELINNHREEFIQISNKTQAKLIDEAKLAMKSGKNYGVMYECRSHDMRG